MKAWRICRQMFLALFLAALSAGAAAQAQPAKQEFKPEVGQEGKDVIWVPTPQELVEKMLDMAKVTPKDYVIDLGSGDGRTVITAAKRGAKALGIEYNPDMVELSKRNAAKESVSDKATFMKADLFEADLSQAQVITMFLLPDINLKLRPKLLNLRPGTRIVSNSFTMGEWQADETANVKNGCASYCTAYLWIVPAKVDGAWQLPQGELMLKQEYQIVSGTLKTDNGVAPIKGKVTGDQIRFTAGGTEYQGRISGNYDYAAQYPSVAFGSLLFGFCRMCRRSAAASKPKLRAQGRPAGQRRSLGADASRISRQDARHGQGHTQRLFNRSGLG
jgi:precorrin-6B methylase 2